MKPERESVRARVEEEKLAALKRRRLEVEEETYLRVVGMREDEVVGRQGWICEGGPWWAKIWMSRGKVG